MTEQLKPKKRVAICIPSNDMVHADFAMALACLMYNPGYPLALINSKGSLVTINRNNSVSEAIHLNTDAVLFLDSDMLFPMDTLRRLMAHEKDIVGATYTKRVPPYEILVKPKDNRPIDVKSGITEVDGLPTGCLLIKTKVFKDMEKPYFRTPVIEEKGEAIIQGEDYYFCETARKLGYQIWLDVDLSREIGHIGQHVFRIPPDKEEELEDAA